MPDTNAAYIKGLLSILRKRDADALREFLCEEAAVRDPEKVREIESISDDEMETRMYKMILARQELSDLHADARRWMRENEKGADFME